MSDQPITPPPPPPPMPGPSTYPAALDLQAPLEVNRWRPLVHWLLAIPHLIVMYALNILSNALLFISFFTILFTKKIPRGMFDVIVMVYRYQWRAFSYFLWMRTDYPPFSFTPAAEDDGIDPASLSVEYPTELKRFMPLVKWILAIPHFIVLFVLMIAAYVVVLISFFAVLITGKYPEGMRNFLVGVARWVLRVEAYAGFLRDEYPPFSLS
jgi:hypothetical protein